ncbi:unnamed protein product [Microthlaspi erraticum]|uniref:Uncharacterized protein n=1 Tax=Microthlaspi erraticum TaxID=1685480 RepID=A0A6D2JN37_9BRAS|nr:unnamed protein product [Microthlaspi erraticum]CAA7045602.1 unnamed protein product [Microthlaspi erraticum]
MDWSVPDNIGIVFGDVRADASWRGDCKVTGLGWEFSSCSDRVLSQHLLMAESPAIRAALEETLIRRFKSLWLEPDPSNYDMSRFQSFAEFHGDV